jgi:hypothetical protein
MMVRFSAKSEKWAEDHRKCNDFDNEPCNNELKLSWAIFVLRP